MALSFETPSPGMRAEADAFMDSFTAAGESEVNGSAGLDGMGDYEAWLGYLERLNTGAEAGLGLGPTQVYFARNGDGAIVGIMDLRPGLPGPKRQWGHVGYSVAPPHRGHGYAEAMLAFGVKRLRAQGVADVLAAVRAGNKASRRVLKKCGFLQTGAYFEPELGEQVINYTNIGEKEQENG